MAYPPIQKEIIKVEPANEPNFGEDEQDFDGQRQLLMAYSPLPKGVVKLEEESQFGGEGGQHADQSNSSGIVV